MQFLVEVNYFSETDCDELKDYCIVSGKNYTAVAKKIEEFYKDELLDFKITALSNDKICFVPKNILEDITELNGF